MASPTSGVFATMSILLFVKISLTDFSLARRDTRRSAVRKSLPLEPDSFFRLGRNDLAIIGVTPFDQLGNEQGSIQLKCNLVFTDDEFHFTFLTQKTLNFSDCLRRNNDFCFLTARKLNFEID